MDDNSRPFLDYNGQIKKLSEEYKLTIKDESFAKVLLNTLSYYDLVNGYKEVFMTDNKFHYGTTIEMLASFYQADARIKNLLLRYALMVETRLKTIFAYHLSEVHGDKIEEYLDVSIYKYSNRLIKNIEKLQHMCKNPKYHPTKHYKETKSHIPPWILFKNIFFSDAIDLFSAYKYHDEVAKQIITKPIQSKYNQAFNAVMIVKQFRNAISHNNKFISYRTSNQIILHQMPSAMQNTLITSNEYNHRTGTNDPYAMILSIFLLLDTPEFNLVFCDDLIVEFTILQSTFDVSIVEKYLTTTCIPIDIISRLKKYKTQINNAM